MQRYKNIVIIGTSHIAIESINEVERYIRSLNPEVIAIELDKRRLVSLFAKKRKLSIKDIKTLGIKGFLFNLIGASIEKKLGNLVGTAPGGEMRKAVELARELKIKIALVDQDINVTLNKLTKSITLKEKLNFFVDIIMGLFKKEKINFDLKKVPNKEIIKKLTTQFKKRYPNMYFVLVEDRNKYMAKNLYRLMLNYNVVLAIVGAGHEEDLIKEIKIWESLVKERKITL
ncbi:MAG: TraB/GumN family protein [Candidatus Nanoarchaeia archaeon]|nr:TraB/GumN family protein [Candidatus Nanoarchaeia archaeon]